MIPYAVPLGLFALLVLRRLLSPAAAPYRWTDAAAWSLATMLVLTGGAHFSSMREDLIRMVPPLLPRADLIVALTGALELLGAVGLLLRPTRVVAGIALALLFVALLPANIYAARHGLTLGGKPVTKLALRIPEQLLYIALALAPAWSAYIRGHRRSAASHHVQGHHSAS